MNTNLYNQQPNAEAYSRDSVIFIESDEADVAPRAARISVVVGRLALSPGATAEDFITGHAEQPTTFEERLGIN